MTERLLEQIRSFREAGNVKRVHTIPRVGDISYTVGAHTFNALTLLYLLHPGPNHQLVRAVLWHDVGERWLGDLPHPAKHYHPALKAPYEEAESAVLERMGVDTDLDDEDKQWLNAIDGLEFWLWCQDQMNMGNKNVVNALSQTEEALLGSENVPDAVKVVLHSYRPKRGEELKDFSNQSTTS